MSGPPKTPEALQLFGRLLRKHRFVLADDLEECLVIQQKLRLMGGAKPLGEVLLDQGYLTLEHVAWILKRQTEGLPLPREETMFGDLAVANDFASVASVEKALRTQKKEVKKGNPRRIGEIIVSDDDMSPPQRDALLLLQGRVRGETGRFVDAPPDPTCLVLEESPAHARRWRPMAVALVAGLILMLLAILVAFAILR
jgi:hypothetical protein